MSQQYSPRLLVVPLEPGSIAVVIRHNAGQKLGKDLRLFTLRLALKIINERLCLLHVQSPQPNPDIGARERAPREMRCSRLIEIAEVHRHPFIKPHVERVIHL